MPRTKREIKYEKECLECGYKTQGVTEYMGFSFLFCDKCNSMKLHTDITTIISEVKEDI